MAEQTEDKTKVTEEKTKAAWSLKVGATVEVRQIGAGPSIIKRSGTVSKIHNKDSGIIDADVVMPDGRKVTVSSLRPVGHNNFETGWAEPAD